MKILHVLPSLSAKHGGPSAAMPALAHALREADVEVTVVSTDDDGPGMHLQVPLGSEIRGQGGARHLYFRKNTEFYKVSFQLWHWLVNHVTEFHVVHIHALFSYSSIAAAVIARRRRVPYVIRPLGVLNRWGMANRRPILKKLSLRWIELPLLRSAAAMHYTSQAEQLEARFAHPAIASLPSAVIPLAIEAANQSAESAQFFAKFPEASGRQIVLFLSRLHPKKGLELLLEAFARVRSKVGSALLVIAGEGTAGYTASLRARANALNLSRDIVWTGFLGGDDKAAAFAAATIFVLPSFSENFGMAALEALAAGVPVILSDQVALSDEIRDADAGLVAPCEVAPFAEKIVTLLLDPELRQRFGTNSRRLVQERFSTQVVGRALKELYQRCTPPKFPASPQQDEPRFFC
jgi:glycosyltransferase involved in cell wall biosynthesis